nr:glycosyltransferase family 2 protein [Bdellovibrio sp. HM001]
MNGVSLDLSIVVPTHNEATNISALAKVMGTLLSAAGISHEIIFVDDGSSDHSWTEIQNLSSSQKGVTGIKFSRNFGKESAIAAGIRNAQGVYTITMDCDLQHPPKIALEMYELATKHQYDVIDAVKEQRQKESTLNRIAANVFYVTFKKLSGVDIHNSTDLRILSPKAKEAYLSLSESAHFFRGMTTWIGYRRAQIYFTPPNRNAGRSHWSIFKLLGLGIRALTSYSSAPLQIVTLLGIIMALFSVVLGAWCLYIYLSHQSLPGFTTVILLQLIIGTVTMLGLGIMGEYVARIYDEVKGRPKYLIAEKCSQSSVQER